MCAFSQEDIVNLKRRVQTVKQQGSVPPIVTHNVVNDDKDGENAMDI